MTTVANRPAPTTERNAAPAPGYSTPAEPIAPASALERLAMGEERLLGLVRSVTPLMLRVVLATVFIWFGALKALGVPTMTASLIAAIVPSFVDPALAATAIGGFEVVLGLAILAGRRLPLVLAVAIGHLAGTFLVLVLRPDVAFMGGNPLMLTVEGEFVMKNLVLIASALALMAMTRTRALAGIRPKH